MHINTSVVQVNELIIYKASKSQYNGNLPPVQQLFSKQTIVRFEGEA